MSYTVIDEVYFTLSPAGTGASSLAAPRCAVGINSDVICTFVAQSLLGISDFVPMIVPSSDEGRTWSSPSPIWPERTKHESTFGSVSRTPSGELLFYGTSTPIQAPGEAAGSEQTQGLKQNSLVWSRSNNGGHTWSPPKVIPMPLPGNAEAPGAMCRTSRGALVCCYAPYRNFDPDIAVETKQIVSMRSTDDGITWEHSSKMKFPSSGAQWAEAWVVELADGRLLGTCWHIPRSGAAPNAYAISTDEGETWSATRSTGTMGQSTALTPLPDDRVLFLFNQRAIADSAGVWLATASPTIDEFSVEQSARIWSTGSGSLSAGRTNLENWTNFTFGEPSAIVLRDHSFLVTLWTSKAEAGAIEFVRFRVNPTPATETAE